MTTVFGYRRDPQNWDQDYTFATGLLPKLKVAVEGDGGVDLRPFCTNSNQYNASACAGNATADSIEILNRGAGLPGIEASRMFVYALARDLHGELAKDEGTYITTCFDVLSRFGICTEQTWAYDLAKVNVLPSLKAMREATRHRIHSYYRIKSLGDERLTEMISALRSKHPVVFGTSIEQAFTSNSGSSVIDTPKGNTIGGHAMIVVGYKPAENLFIVKNSWGSGWRDGGYAYFTADYMKWEHTWDMWVPTIGADLTL